jgi:hypothetical protein
MSMASIEDLFDGPWMTPPQVAELLVVDPAKVISWIKRGELDASDVALGPGRRPRWRIEPAALRRFLERRKPGAPAPKTPRRTKSEDVIPYY